MCESPAEEAEIDLSSNTEKVCPDVSKVSEEEITGNDERDSKRKVVASDASAQIVKEVKSVSQETCHNLNTPIAGMENAGVGEIVTVYGTAVLFNSTISHVYKGSIKPLCSIIDRKEHIQRNVCQI